MGGIYTCDGLRCCDICGRSCRDGGNRTVRSDVPRRGYRAVKDVWSGYVLHYARRVRFAVRVARCPHNYCPPIAACTDCRAAKKHLHCASQREQCRRRSEEFHAEIREEAKRKLEVMD